VIPRILQLDFFHRHREYGVIFLRLIIGSFIIWGVQDNILSSERMEEFAEFLGERGVPYPLFAACLSAYTQMVCGVCILFGAATRLAAIPFIINFIAALFIAHRGDTFRGMFPALMMLCAGFFFLFHGAGKLSVDEALAKRAE
jgi:putative oxidoreductase